MQGAYQELDDIKKLAEMMLLWPEDERITMYKKIDAHLLKLEGALTRSPNAEASQVLSELKFHLIILARLYEPDDLTDDQHYERVVSALETLGNSVCVAFKQSI